ncbi:MAG: hypothetical protein AB8F26_01200 [Phycisphaerales bacterium]
MINFEGHAVQRMQTFCALILSLVMIPSAAFAGIRPVAERVDAIVGHPIVLPVVVEDVKELKRPPSVRLDDARVLDVAVYRLMPAAPVDAGWAGRVSRWSAESAEAAIKRDPLPAGVWYAVVDLPIDAVSQGIWFDDVRYEVNWLPDPERAALEAGGRSLWSSPVPEAARESAALQEALDTIAGDPFQRWRVRLCADGIAPIGSTDRTDATGSVLEDIRADLAESDQDRFFQEVARSHEARWQLILGRLALIDEETAHRLRRRLGGVVLIDGVWLPSWMPDSTDLRSLQSDLLSPWVDDDTRELRARAWLDSKPKAIAWVIDDGGSELFGESRMSPTLGVLSLPARDADMLVEVAGPIGGPELVRATSRISTRVVGSVPMVERRGRSDAIRTNSLPVRIGRSDATVQPVATVVAARPPGVRVGPLLNAWTMGALLSNEPDQGSLPSAARSATGLVRRSGAPGDSDAASGWSVFMRCAAAAPAAGGDEASDWVTVWAGPFGVPRGVWRVSRSGSVQTLFGPAPVDVSFVDEDGGWAFDLKLPRSVVDPDGVLRIGFERDLGGTRTSWPRRMTPGQEEPGRLPIDTRAWSGL